MSAVSARMFSHRVSVLRPQRTHDGQGGFTDTWVVTVPQLQCRLTDTKLTTRTDEAGQLVSDVTRTLYCPPGSNINSGDRTLIAGVAWAVQAADEQPDGIYRKAYLLAEQPA